MSRTSSLALCLLIGTLMGCPKPPPPKSAPPPAPVTVAVSQKKTVPIQVRTIGTVKALAMVSIRPRVGGEITEVHFKEGDYVTKNQKLLIIDPRPYEVAVRSAQAALGKSREVLRGAERELERLERVGVASAVELDVARTNAASAKASVAVEEAALESAKLQLGFTTINSPIDGRVGELLVNRGNLVEATGSTPLVVIYQVSPISVAFALPEQQLPLVMAARQEGPLAVEAHLRNGESSHKGTLSFIDNAVNTGSGTVMLKAEFPNEDRQLWPGQFVDVTLTIRERPDSVVIPSEAVQAGQKGTYVYVVKSDNTVEYRDVTVALEWGEESVIASGLSAGETVVAEGQLRLVNGAKVSVKGNESPTPASAEKLE